MGACKSKPPASGPDPGSDAGGALSPGKTAEEQDAEDARAFTDKCTELFALFATGDDFDLKELIKGMKDLCEKNDTETLNRLEQSTGIPSEKVKADKKDEITDTFNAMSGNKDKVDKQMFTDFIRQYEAKQRRRARLSSKAEADSKASSSLVPYEGGGGVEETKSNTSGLDMDLEVRLLRHEITALEHQEKVVDGMLRMEQLKVRALQWELLMTKDISEKRQEKIMKKVSQQLENKLGKYPMDDPQNLGAPDVDVWDASGGTWTLAPLLTNYFVDETILKLLLSGADAEAKTPENTWDDFKDKVKIALREHKSAQVDEVVVKMFGECLPSLRRDYLHYRLSKIGVIGNPETDQRTQNLDKLWETCTNPDSALEKLGGRYEETLKQADSLAKQSIVDEWSNLFVDLDMNHNGVLGQGEIIKRIKKAKSAGDDAFLERLRTSLGLPDHARETDGSRDEFEAVFHEMDKDNDKEISFQEFRDYALKHATGADAPPSVPSTVVPPEDNPLALTEKGEEADTKPTVEETEPGKVKSESGTEESKEVKSEPEADESKTKQCFCMGGSINNTKKAAKNAEKMPKELAIEISSDSHVLVLNREESKVVRAVKQDDGKDYIYRDGVKMFRRPGTSSREILGHATATLGKKKQLPKKEKENVEKDSARMSILDKELGGDSEVALSTYDAYKTQLDVQNNATTSEGEGYVLSNNGTRDDGALKEGGNATTADDRDGGNSDETENVEGGNATTTADGGAEGNREETENVEGGNATTADGGAEGNWEEIENVEGGNATTADGGTGEEAQN